MLILQSCPVCFEEFDASRKPHTITCGHVFCHPCLEAINQSGLESAKCPICRTRFNPDSARAVIGSDQPRQEAKLWESLKGYTKGNCRTEQLPCLPSKEELTRIGASEGICIAVDTMRMLLHAENSSFELEVKSQQLQVDRDILSRRVANLEYRLKQLQGALIINTSHNSMKGATGQTESYRSNEAPRPSISSDDDDPPSPRTKPTVRQ
ncbi:hypothetical protein RSOLAG1IB_08371 [Rhizoctonia solani AG-1 IB]|uniref:RING-type domain-containing protein n=1 Tax=Thanatephorus cucumeris (strain AG1-IB / isolate 7/3/14) TaxID=1108050 RepID=A0A0B7FJS6_THACB|nr:hypothetical protein RSOLAG1IB_08371 [Rhizoctonia solani AG-1 IB]